jgi:hypothetical protein
MTQNIKQAEKKLFGKKLIYSKPLNPYKKDLDELLFVMQKIDLKDYYGSQQTGTGFPILTPLIISLISSYGVPLIEKAYAKLTGGSKSTKDKMVSEIARFINNHPHAVSDLFVL